MKGSLMSVPTNDELRAFLEIIGGMEVLQQAAESSTFGDEYAGFCIACGEYHDGCEPDARGYECDACGAMKVYGAEEIMIYVAGTIA